jgi:thiol-disulfide isomerase/thioredoxin
MSRPDWRGSAVALLFVWAATSWLGCGPSAAGDSAPPTRPPPAPTPTIELTSVDRTGYDQVVAGRRGQVVLVDTWATWCLPCVEQLSHTVAAAKRYGDQGLAVVTLSFDDPDEAEHVREVLRAKGADKLTNLISQFGGGSQSVEAFEVPGGALPHYKLYDRQGKLRRTFEVDPAAERQFTTSDVDAAVAELLAE